ncbi:MAG: polysaccharide deacetylase family protein [Oscillospiraceae bacterium]|nr:polysaccharide deacetylase family protein [Oscillospiraceae bacterium]
MEKYLIINADDFGSFYGANKATEELLDRGCITSATVMMPCMWARMACLWAAKNPQHAVGIHLTNTSEWQSCKWPPVLAAGTASLRDAEGYLWEDCRSFEENADLDEVKAECLAQLNLAKQLGLNPSHWDNHMGSLYGVATGRLELLQQTLELSAQQGLPFRFPLRGMEQEKAASNNVMGISPETLAFVFKQIAEFVDARGIACPDFLIPGEWTDDNTRNYEAYRDYMFEFVKCFPHGVTETFIHPCIDTGEITEASNTGIRRVWEYQLYLDPKFQQHMKDIGIVKINYRDLAKMRGTAK